ncbi:MAG: SEC-C metal-binding domain-containing protein [Bacillota bacterium]|uniref:SEC-C motif-containing protein n=1 Tax=[Clostridium] aminophilum TaxID=1526 RepID=A0A1I6ISQ8_9FIRM|nr:SEC-C metal-binding domain-containing protein [[Clostridium] aminophilum]MCR4629849.1 SEC-C domain-containing protein [Clostridium sp.]MDT3845309.1 SEC-C metal-binding domain-containing protein [Bacillota bacterium]SFR69270.1 SEC-C motif-containing protein [[Clostridium] aminophilum]
MSLLENWRNLAYGDALDQKQQTELWNRYFEVEKGIYEQILSAPETEVKGTVKELAEKYGTDVQTMTGFLDGISESLKDYKNPIETMEEDTEVRILIDPEKLYYNMVEAKATWLYELPQWDSILSQEKRTELYRAQKASGTIRREGRKIYPNDACPCGSGKKYKKCHGKNA